MHSRVINKSILYIQDIILLILCIVADRISKYYAITKLKDHPAVSAFNGLLEFRYTENPGAAFSVLEGQTSFFILIFIVVLFTGIYYIIKSPGRIKYIHSHICIAFILGGAIGNIADRILYSAVIDFIYFISFDFPIFNVADVFLTVGTVGLVLALVFYYKEDDLNFLRFKEKKIREI
ncbi:MAG: signal peptidase II [Lachnospiraceae bacterium]|nr:signal peptidase II [Lachnospiraceae bacterium]